MKRCSSNHHILRIEYVQPSPWFIYPIAYSCACRYIGEEGVGDGPTREFFTLASQEFQKKKLNMWLCDDGEIQGKGKEEGEEKSDEHVFSARGLFPRPFSWKTSDKEKSEVLVR